MGKGALANHWDALGKSKKGQALREKYTKVFNELVEENYLERVRLYFGGRYQIVFTGEEPKAFGSVVMARIKKKDVDVIVEFIMKKIDQRTGDCYHAADDEDIFP